MSPTKDQKSSDYDNPSHIVKKQKAVEKQFHKKNLKEIIDLMDEEDSEIAEKYVRFIK